MKQLMETFEISFEKVMHGSLLPMDAVMRYAAEGRGKRLRPQLVFLTAQLFGEVNGCTRRTAMFAEMLHTATLIHDDVVDGSDERRGRASVNARFGNKAAVLAGDYLLSKASLLLSHPEDRRVLDEMLHAAMAMSEGELIQCSGIEINSEEEYLDIIGRKTAELIRACCVCGALSVDPGLSSSLHVSAFGWNLGLVFQMRDDLLDHDTPEIAALAERLLPEHLDKALKALHAMGAEAVHPEVLGQLEALTRFCAERDH